MRIRKAPFVRWRAVLAAIVDVHVTGIDGVEFRDHRGCLLVDAEPDSVGSLGEARQSIDRHDRDVPDGVFARIVREISRESAALALVGQRPYGTM
jgi:hypothetical protein